MISIAVQAPRSDTRFGSIKARPTWSGSYHENMPYRSQHYDGGHDAYGSAASGLPGTTRMPTSESSSAGRPTLPPLSSLLPNRAASRNASRQSPARMDSPELTSSSDKSVAFEHLRRSPSAKTPKLDEQAMMRPPQQYQLQSHRWHAQDATNARDDSDGDVSRRVSVNNILQASASRSPPVAQSESDYRRSAYSSSTSHESSSIRTSQLRAERDHALPPLTSLNILSPRKDLPTSPQLQHAQHLRATPSSHDGEGGGLHAYQQQPVRQHSFSISSSSHASTSPMEARRHTALFPSHAAYPEQSRPSLHPPPVDSASGHARRRWSDDAPNDVDPQDSYEMEIFDRLCDLLMYVKEQNDQHDVARSPSNARSAPAMPLVRKGDFIGVSTLIRREIDVLHDRDPHLARSLADDEFALLEQQKQHRISSMSSASVASQNSRFGPERTGRRSTYTLGSGASLAPSSALRGPLSRYDYHNSHSRGSLPPFVHRNDVGTLPYPYQAAGGYGASHRGSYGSDYYDQRHDARNFERGMPRYPLHEDELLHHHPQYAGQQHLLGANAMPRRVRKRRDEADQSCLSCAATETPEWRKGPTGPRTLCNACGLLFAKQCRKRELDAQARGERPKGGRALAPEDMTADEKERSLIELQMAVHARTGQTTGLPATMMPSAVSGLPGRH